ncbi:MAG: hypothetical protein R3C69_18690 [Geminicoccaceae bacterium]
MRRTAISTGRRTAISTSTRRSTISRLRPTITAADAVVLGSYVPEGARRGASPRRRRRAGRLYDIDTPVTLAKLEAGDHEYLTPALIPRFDLYLSFSGGAALEALVGRWGARVADRSVAAWMRALPPARAREAVGHGLSRHLQRRPPAGARAAAAGAGARLPERRFVVAGPQYPRGIDWPANVERIEHVPPTGHAAFYGACASPST